MLPPEALHPVATALRILFISLEFRAGTFSGNGVYACAQVRALAAAGHKVFVVSAAPAHAGKPEDDLGAHRIVEVPVSSWHRLDAGAPWREFAAGASDPAVTQAVAAFAPQYVFGVDWSALAAVRALAPYTRGAPYVYLNYRVFCRTAAGDDLELVRGLESAAMAEALLTVALSRSDVDYLVAHVAGRAAEGAGVKAGAEAVEGVEAAAEGPAAAEGAETPSQAAGAKATGAREAAEADGTNGTQNGAGRHDASAGSAAAAAAANGHGNGHGSSHCLENGKGHAAHADVTSVAPPANVCGVAYIATAGANGKGTCAAPYAHRPQRPKVLLPALREDVRQLQPPLGLARLAEALAALQHSQQELAAEAEVVAGAEAEVAARPYLACVVRLSPEKEPERFVEVVEAMAARGLLARLGVRPLLLGAANDEYAQALKARLRAAAPDALILESFVGPAQLAELYRATRLNFHPPAYDAYGMTIVEAASQGAPSVVHDGGGAVGATDLLRGGAAAAAAANSGRSSSSGSEEVFLLDLTAPAGEVAEAVAALWGDVPRLAATAARALARARSWDEAANAAQLVALVAEAQRDAQKSSGRGGSCRADGYGL
ncbi:hypothetical protein HYH02_009864 [Chlamydomonas schloesseri]|uniref:Glycosyl transferase family 1 domain-containing protein n=1 Tax=Chlamydomonas schloesseri TaxID=2026947 RepID=A0A835TBE9_9CHLO|nr:hypothetical protein HYH02_009864 [Chlamydomonas schloesseri]|eukprot:KAG2442073.1 hypothetical protein HYH02_009864 [Chlamydomonas schloesseri]